MQIVIDIPEELFNIAKDGMLNEIQSMFIVGSVVLGTPLPKGHGDLKDMSNLQYVFDLTRDDPIYSGKDIKQAIKSMKSIIKADNTESEDKYGKI